MSDKKWFLHEYDERYNPPKDNGFWAVSNVTTDRPEVGTEYRVVNRVGGYHYHIIEATDELVFSTWEQVDYRYYSQNQDAPYGWIDKDGHFFGCDYMEHADCAMTCFNMSEFTAESAGYVKIFKEPTLAKYDPTHFQPSGFGWFCQDRLTDAQKATLTERGFSYDEEYD